MANPRRANSVVVWWWLPLMGLVCAPQVEADGGYDLGSPDVRQLAVGLPLDKETLPLDGGSCIYQIKGLGPLTSYEIKISYPASLPASFKLEWEESGGGVRRQPRPSRRRVLDTEKIMFMTDEHGRPQGAGGGRDWPVEVIVSVQRAGVGGGARREEQREEQRAVFNIECEELRMGIPLKAWRMGGFVVVGLLIVFILAQTLPASLLPHRVIERIASRQQSRPARSRPRTRTRDLPP